MMEKCKFKWCTTEGASFLPHLESRKTVGAQRLSLFMPCPARLARPRSFVASPALPVRRCQCRRFRRSSCAAAHCHAGPQAKFTPSAHLSQRLTPAARCSRNAASGASHCLLPARIALGAWRKPCSPIACGHSIRSRSGKPELLAPVATPFGYRLRALTH